MEVSVELGDSPRFCGANRLASIAGVSNKCAVFLELGNEVRVVPFAKKLGSITFQQASHSKPVLDLLPDLRFDESAAIGMDLNEALGFESLQRLADRCPADPEHFCHALDVDPLSRLQLPFENCCTKAIAGLIGQGRVSELLIGRCCH